jgi:hypothetical protein
MSDVNFPPVPQLILATFQVMKGDRNPEGEPFEVQFNPTTLEFTVANEFDSNQGSNGTAQYVKKTTRKLAMTLVFDTCDTGEDVLKVTANLSSMLKPEKIDKDKKYAPLVKFCWGGHSLKGVIEQYKETIEFFSPEGIALRSSVAITLSSQEVAFRPNGDAAPSADRQPPEPLVMPTGTAPDDICKVVGDPRAARSVGLANGSESLRFGGNDGLSVGGLPELSGLPGVSQGNFAGMPGPAPFLPVPPAPGMDPFAMGGSTFPGSLDSITAAGSRFEELRTASPFSALPISVEEARAMLLPSPPGTGGDVFGPGGRARMRAAARRAAENMPVPIKFGD